MKRKKNLCFIFTVIITMLISTNLVSAYVPVGLKWSGSTFPISVTYKWGSNLGTSSVIRTAYQQALTDWNGAQMRIKFTESSSSSNELNSYYVSSSSAYGYNDLYGTGTTYTKFMAFVNAGNSNITKTYVARSVAGHELGHAMSLDEGNVLVSLMNQNRNRESIYTPKQDDLDGVNEQY